MVQPIIPKYAAELANTAIDLATAPVELTAGKESVSGIGTARLDLTAKERVVIEVSVGHEAFGFRREDDLCLKFGPHGRKTPVLSTLSTFSSDGNALLSLVVRRGTLEIVRNRRVHLSCALVHILNFPDFFCLEGKSTDFHHNERLLGRVIMHIEDWEIEIQALPFTHKLVKQLKAQGGNAITHVARITRANGKSFTRAKLDALVHDLQRFLSFARGSWTSVFGTVGYDRDGQEVYQDWGERISAPWQVCRSWFDIHRGQCLADAFPGFVKLLHDPQLGSAAYAGQSLQVNGGAF